MFERFTDDARVVVVHAQQILSALGASAAALRAAIADRYRQAS